MGRTRYHTFEGGGKGQPATRAARKRSGHGGRVTCRRLLGGHEVLSPPVLQTAVTGQFPASPDNTCRTAPLEAAQKGAGDWD